MATGNYYPAPESKGGWRYLTGDHETRARGGMDSEALNRLKEEQDRCFGRNSWAIAIVRHGYLVREYYTFNVLVPTRFDVWSCTKSFTGTAWSLLLDDQRASGRVTLDSPAYSFIPDGYPLSDPRKEHITIRHLLTMTSGIPGESVGVVGIPTATEHGPFEHALGRCPNRYGHCVDQLLAEPGTRWDYSDPAFCHLALAFAHIAGREIGDFMQERIFGPIGIENVSWDVQGGSGFLGPHTNAHTGVHISARQLARLGYLLLRDGVWEGKRLVPHWWIELAGRTSQDLNKNYGYTCWVNTAGMWPDVPRDAFAFLGYRANRCYIIPSLDLVVARIGSGPAMGLSEPPDQWDDKLFLKLVMNAIVDS